MDGKTEFGVRAEVAVGDGGTGWWRATVGENGGDFGGSRAVGVGGRR